MALKNPPDPLKAIDHGTGKIDLTHLGTAAQYVPTELHIKQDGAIGDTPIFCFVLESLISNPVFGQLSLNMWNEAMESVGYKIVKTVRQQAKDLVLKEYPTEMDVATEIDETYPDYVDDRWEDDDYDDKWSWYIDHCNKVAEHQIRDTLGRKILSELKMTLEEYEQETGEPIWETVCSVYEILD